MDIVKTLCQNFYEGNKGRTHDDSFVITTMLYCKAETCDFYFINDNKRKYIGLKNNDKCMGLPAFYYTDGRGDRDGKLCNLFYGGEEAIDLKWIDLKDYLTEEDYDIYLKFKPEKLTEHYDRL